MTIEGLRLKVRKKYFKLTAKIRNNLIKNKDFTIISNNCWGGFVYQSYGIEYSTPTVGLFFMAEDYVKFLSNIKYYINECNLEFINPKDSKYVEYLLEDARFGKYPIGVLDDVEIEFLHYSSEEEAREKWNRRKKRINWDKLIIKFNDQNNCTIDTFEKFVNLNIKHKLFFTVDPKYKSDFSVIKKRNQKNIYASQEPVGASLRCNINKIINGL